MPLDQKRVRVVDVIATRGLTSVDANGARGEVHVVVGRPQSSPDGSHYACPTQIIGIGKERVHEFFGIDAVQAIQLSMRALGAQLEAFAHEACVRIEWDSSGRGDLGFPE